MYHITNRKKQRMTDFINYSSVIYKSLCLCVCVYLVKDCETTEDGMKSGEITGEDERRRRDKR